MKEEKETGSRDWCEWDQQGLVKTHYQEVKSAKYHNLSSHEHYHGLMHVTGNHGWSDRKIAAAITEIERARNKRHWEKDIHVDFGWTSGNRFHRYIAREAHQEERKMRRRLKNGRWSDLIEQQDKWFELKI
jgi:hypothetical protein